MPCFLVFLEIVSCEDFCLRSKSDGACETSSVEEASLAESYLQNFAFRGDRKLQITAEGEQEEAPRGPQAPRVSVQLLDLAGRSSLLSRSEARARSYKGHSFYLRRVLSALEMNHTEVVE